MFSFALRAQVSPGALSRAHKALDSPLKCANCHVFGAGKAKLRCLHCHAAIRVLIAEKRGFHARSVHMAKGEIDCARCHTEHYGEDFNIAPWPKSKEEFDHHETGFPLVGHHAKLKCEQCHQPKFVSADDRKRMMGRDLTKTFIGLRQACISCHEDRHAGQLGVQCQRCHDSNAWKPLHGFDHNNTHYPLTGKHENVECAKCHKPQAANPKVIQYTGLNFKDCSGCHQDPHHGAFTARCESCHNTGGWKQVHETKSSFDHSKTKFPLLGKHETVPCLKCHKGANFKIPVPHAKCIDCHQDVHKGQFADRPGGPECAPCHNEKGFKPSLFTVASHQTTKFPLEGKHNKVECAKCHTPAGPNTSYHPAFKACMDCHKDPHGAQFAGPPVLNQCDKCHTVDAFKPSTFTLARHKATKFPLSGAHQAVACSDCHHKESAPNKADRQYHFERIRCQGCHTDPHRGEFPDVLAKGLKPEQDVCERCHGLTSWRALSPFDHSTTGYTLLGAHKVIACIDCHRPGSGTPPKRLIPFKGAAETCAGCHEDIHAGQFNRAGEPPDCGRCHSQAVWSGAEFNHNKTKFSLTGAHERVPCRLCHFQKREFNGRTIVVYNAAPVECAACHRR